MTAESIEQDFRRRLSGQVRLEAEGVDRFRVFTPFHFEDGDHLAIVLRKDGPRWLLSDEGHTHMRLGSGVDEQDAREGTRQKIVSGALPTFQVEERHGELVLEVTDARYGDALHAFVQALLRVSGVLNQARDRMKSTADGVVPGQRTS